MNRCQRALLAPLLAVLAVVLGFGEKASAAFNQAAQNPHYGENLLWKSEASAFGSLQPADPTKGNGEWVYDSALGVPVYVRQNPWTFFDPLGLKRDLPVSEAMEDGELSKKEANRIKWEDGQAEKFLESSNPDKLTNDKETRSEIVKEDVFGNEYIHPTYSKAREAWKNGASIDEAVGGETARRNRTRANWELWRVAGSKDDKQRIRMMMALYEVASIAAIPMGAANPTHASRIMSQTGAKAGTQGLGEFKPNHLIRTDNMSRNQYQKLVKSIKKNGLKNPVIDYTVVGGKPFIVTGSNRMRAARELGITDQLQYNKVTLPYKGYKSSNDVIEGAVEVNPSAFAQ